jgi:hypothetical protein
MGKMLEHGGTTMRECGRFFQKENPPLLKLVEEMSIEVSVYENWYELIIYSKDECFNNLCWEEVFKLICDSDKQTE